jgi:hypothetical protein
MLNFCGSIKEVGYDTGDRVESVGRPVLGQSSLRD